MKSAFGVLAKFKGLRGTAFDVFGYTEERKTERALIVEYRALVDELLASLSADRLADAVGARVAAGRDPRLRPREGAPSREGAREVGHAAGRLARRPRGEGGVTTVAAQAKVAR